MYYKTHERSGWIRAIIICIVLCMGIIGQAEGHRIVKVAFFPMEGFHNYDLNGQPSGMDVDYLTALCEYTDWEIEYVDCKSWDEALSLVKEGKADLVGSAQYTPERAKSYLYAEIPSGYTFGAVAVGKDSDLAYEDFDVMKDITYGMVKTYVRKNDFLSYLAEHGITDPKIIEYDNTAELQQALDNQEIDALVHTYMELKTGQRIIGRFAPSPFFYITSQDNEKLMQDLNQAASDLKMENSADCFEKPLTK